MKSNSTKNTSHAKITRVDISVQVHALRSASNKLAAVFCATGGDEMEIEELEDQLRSLLDETRIQVTQATDELEEIDGENFRQWYAAEHAA